MSQQSGDKALSAITRRRFLARVGAAAGGAAAMAAMGKAAIAGASTAASAAEPAVAAAPTPVSELRRRNRAFRIRVDAARFQRDLPLPSHPDNGDEKRYPNRIGSYSRTLPHNDLGEVDSAAYDLYLAALASGNSADFELIPMGGAGRLINPQAAFTFGLEGSDSHHLAIPPAWRFDSLELAGEMVELYWQALLRDVNFADYQTNPDVAAAAAELSTFPNFAGVTPATLFRGSTPGDLAGPYISQFLYLNVPYGTTGFAQNQFCPIPGDDHVTTFEGWLNGQRGGAPLTSLTLETQRRYLRNARDLAEWLRRDFSYQGGISAALILIAFGGPALSPVNPYLSSQTQRGFITFGPVHVLDIVARVSAAAARAAWFQKWLVHRRLRPDDFAARIHLTETGLANYPVHQAVLDSEALARTHDRYGTFVLPMGYPEGSPAHPAYPSGHAILGGSFATVLKAFFNESFAFPSPVQPSADGLALEPYPGTLTVGDELNKLAANVGIGRDMAGIHWVTDITQGNLLGEQITIGVLRDLKRTFTETGAMFQFTKFDGTQITI